MPFDALPTRRLPSPLARALDRLLQIEQMEDLYREARTEPSFVTGLLAKLAVRIDVSARDLANIPATGPVVAVCNHPFGILDGIVTAEVLTRVRPDVRILTSRMLGDLEELAPLCFFVDPFDKPENRATNARGLRNSIAHLRAGGLLMIFPAGEVSHFDVRTRSICDPLWSPTAARLIQLSGARALPILIAGSNSLGFQMLGLVHPKLRTAALPAQLLNKRGKVISVRVAAPIQPDTLRQFDAAGLTQYLRVRSRLLAHRHQPAPLRTNGLAPIPPATATHLRQREVAALAPDCQLAAAGDLAVYYAEAAHIPAVLHEICRLREITFRAAGEGTGQAIDHDRYDLTYRHLFVWNHATSEVVGAYRIGDVPELLQRFGADGLYTTSLFRFQNGFFARLGPALELGRSFVRLEYQRQFTPLLLLWKGICTLVARRPQYKMLIGAVTMSNQYSAGSRELMARYFEMRGHTGGLLSPVRPRHKLRGARLQKHDCATLCALVPAAEDLSIPIRDLELDGKGLPVLIQQYVKMGGKLMAFSVDPRFGDALDAFVQLDLTAAPPRALARYMGQLEAARFLAAHAQGRAA